MKCRRRILTVLLVVFCAVFLVSGFMLLREMMQHRQARQEFDALAEMVMQSPQPTPESTPGVQASQQPEPSAQPRQKRNIAALQALNSHCIGWLCIPDTNINYPVMHTPNEPQYYLRLNFQQRYSVAGTPFLDYRCTTESENMIIYGHNMNDGSMFGDLLKYLDEEYLALHPVVEFETTQECVYYQVIDVRQVVATDEWYSFGFAPGEGEYLTLSTCDSSGQNNRVILIAQRMD